MFKGLFKKPEPLCDFSDISKTCPLCGSAAYLAEEGKCPMCGCRTGCTHFKYWVYTGPARKKVLLARTPQGLEMYEWPVGESLPDTFKRIRANVARILGQKEVGGSFVYVGKQGTTGYVAFVRDVDNGKIGYPSCRVQLDKPFDHAIFRVHTLVSLQQPQAQRCYVEVG